MDSGCEVGDNTKMWAECQKLWGSSNSPISPLFAAMTFVKVQRSAKLPPSLGRSTVGDSAAFSMVVLVLIGVLLICSGLRGSRYREGVLLICSGLRGSRYRILFCHRKRRTSSSI